MLPACFNLAESVFPRVKAEAARQLIAQSWSQSKVAEALGVSQAMVSKYASRPADDDPLVLRMATDVLVAANGHDSSNAWCGLLATPQDGQAALNDLLRAERILLQASPIHLVPQVGLNIARALPGAKAAGDVLAYPGRMVAAGDRLVAPVAPSLGASNHLAACLLALRRRDPSIHAIANVRECQVEAARMEGDGPRVALFEAAVNAATSTPLLIHDPGAIGIEPCLYVAGATAEAVAQTILSLPVKS